jgi:hypothetical protein
MNTRNHFDSFTPGMKAKLDPTYRRTQKAIDFPQIAGMPRDNKRYSHHSLLPFTSSNKASRITDRMI